MNPAAGNALLKVLEEPPQRTMLILISAQPYDLLPTIVSRCQMIRFNPISRDILENLLVEQHGVPAGDAKLIAAMANGSLTRALTMVRSNWIRRRNWIIQEIEALSSQPVSRILLLAEKLARDKEALPQILESAQSWLRDLAIYPYCPDQVVNYDLPSKCRHALESSNLDKRLEQFQTLAAAHNQLQTNAAVRLLLEKALLRLGGAEGPAHSTVRKQP
jgi:DNA polymerase-3 subunit delta'